MSKDISYKVSYFRPGEPSSVDIYVNTHGEKTYGFQFVADVVATPQIQLEDKDPTLDGVQLDISNNSQLNFITNEAKVTDNGYQIVLASITSNPEEYFATDTDTLVAKLVFTQDQAGTILIQPDMTATKMPSQSESSETTVTNNTEQTTTDVSAPVQTLATEDTGNKLQELDGEIYQAPTEDGVNDLNTSQSFTPSTFTEIIQSWNPFSTATDSVTERPNNMLGFSFIAGTIIVIILILVVMLRFRKRSSQASSISTEKKFAAAAPPQSQPTPTAPPTEVPVIPQAPNTLPPPLEITAPPPQPTNQQT